MKNKIKRALPVSILAAGCIIFIFSGGAKYLTLEELSNNYKAIREFAYNYYFLSILIYVGTYIVAVAFSIPGATVLTLIGGFLFGAVFGTVAVVFSATIGATITYFAVHTAFGNILKEKAGGSIQKLHDGFKENELGYMLFIRLVPLFPFFVINIAAGIFDVKPRNFILGTLLGIIPGSFTYAWVGSGLGYTLSKGESVDMGIIFEPQVLFPLLLLALLSILPSIYKKVKHKKKEA